MRKTSLPYKLNIYCIKLLVQKDKLNDNMFSSLAEGSEPALPDSLVTYEIEREMRPSHPQAEQRAIQKRKAIRAQL